MNSNNKTKKKKKQSQLPVALVYSSALVVCLAIFGIIGYLAVKDFVPGAEADIADSYAEEQVSFTRDDSATILYTIANSQNDLLSIIVARFMPSAQQLVVIPVSPYTDCGGQSLGAIYSSSGISDMTAKTGELLHITIDKYMTMTDSTFTDIANIMGASIVTLVDDAMLYDRTNDEYIYYSKGDRVAFDGAMALQLLSYDFPGGHATNMKISGEIAAALINTFFSHTESSQNNIDAIFKKQYADANTNMSTDEYNQMKSAIIYVIENSSSPSYSLTPTGGWSDDGLFTIDSAFISQLDGYFND